jgi:Mg/Co/Ni transporter MgtE
MLRVALIALLLATPAAAQQFDFSKTIPYPVGAIPITASSGNVAAATATCTLPALAGKTTYLTGFVITAGGATAAAVVTGSVSGIVNGPDSFTYGAPAGATAYATPLVVMSHFGLPGTAINTAIVISMPSLGAGNTNTTITCSGYQN